MVGVEAKVPVEAKVAKRTGKHPDKRLSAVTVRRTSTSDRYCDGGGLYLVVEDTGAKRWQFRTVVAGKRTEIGLGGLATVSLADAREEALRLRKLVRAGGHPLLERRRARRAPVTFKAATEAVHQAHAKTFKNPKHAAQKGDLFVGPRAVRARPTVIAT